jgi:hypothetical protein
MIDQLLATVVAWLDTPAGTAVTNAIIIAVILGALKWVGSSIAGFFTGLPRRFERWLSRRSSTL